MFCGYCHFGEIWKTILDKLDNHIMLYMQGEISMNDPNRDSQESDLPSGLAERARQALIKAGLHGWSS